MIVVGLGSGTSIDGIDLAAVDLALDGDVLRARVVATAEEPVPPPVREAVLAASLPSADSGQAPARLVTLADAAVGRAFAEAVARFVRGLPAGERPELVASHGQTLWHEVERGVVTGTLQVGRPAWIAELTGLPVVSDLRAADVAAGGQGAPLAATWDALWLGGRDETVAALNLGGIANATVVDPGGDLLAFDSGPANALLDAAIAWRTGGERTFDADGAVAARGTVDEALLDALLAEPYYARPAPKTTGKELFDLAHLRAALASRGAGAGRPTAEDIPLPDLLATLVELTARTVAEALTRAARPGRPVRDVVVSGGGARHLGIMAALARLLPDARVRVATDLGLDADAKEACLFALLGWLTWHGLPGTIPSATGARIGRVAGQITPGDAPLRLPEPLTTFPRALEIAS